MIKRRIPIPILRLLACTLALLTLSACNQEKRLMEHFPEWEEAQGELPELKIEPSIELEFQGIDFETYNLTVHRDYENKSCPGDYIYSRLGQIAKEVNQKLSGAPAGPFKPYQGQVNADDGLNCRTAPVSGSVLKTYLDGTVLTITKEDGNWGYCSEGWVCLDYINKIASANDAETKEDTRSSAPT